jgi:lipopolysaccharide biosynthesis glycosyltransferase
MNNCEVTLDKDRTVAKSNEPIVVVLAADNNYAMPLAVTIRSVIENLKGKCNIIFYVIDGGITDINKQKILKSLSPEKCEVRFIQISDALIEEIAEAHKPMDSEGINTKAEYVSIASFYRLLIPELIPEHFKKVIYLDCDLAIEGNLEELWQADLGDNYVLAVRDTWIPSISSPTGKLNYQELGIDSDAPYFNAGVLVIDLEKWRADRFSTKAIEYFSKNLEHIGWYDQGLLNALLIGQWGQLDPRWNFNATSYYDYDSGGYLSWENSKSFLARDAYDRLITFPYIVHFVSNKKPWTSRHCPRKQAFFKYVDLTEWSGWRLTVWKRLQLRFASEIKTVMHKISFG